MPQLKRPDHPDFSLISQSLIDAQADSTTGGFQEILGRIVEPEVLEYAALVRANAARHAAKLGAATEPSLGAAFIDGFVAGARFQHLKASSAEGSKPEEFEDPTNS